MQSRDLDFCTERLPQLSCDCPRKGSNEHCTGLNLVILNESLDAAFEAGGFARPGTSYHTDDLRTRLNQFVRSTPFDSFKPWRWPTFH